MVHRAHPGRRPEPGRCLDRQLGVEYDRARRQARIDHAALDVALLVGDAANRREFAGRERGRHRDVDKVGTAHDVRRLEVDGMRGRGAGARALQDALGGDFHNALAELNAPDPLRGIAKELTDLSTFFGLLGDMTDDFSKRAAQVQSMLTAPRVYFAMAEDGLFFKRLAKLNRARVPALAIALQGALAIVICFSGRYEQILNYVVSSDVIFFALTAACVFAFRRRDRNPTVREGAEGRVEMSTLPDGRVSAAGSFRIPGHPLTTLFFIAACGAVAFSTIQRYPSNSLIGLAIMLSGLPVYFVWASLRKRSSV